MTTGRYRRGNATLRQVADRRSQRENNFFLAIVGFSLLSHIIVAALFLYKPTPNNRRRPPTLYVDLVMAPPVINPQRGSAGVVNKTPPPAATVRPIVTPPPPTVPPSKVAKAPVVVKAPETKKPAAVQDDDIAADIATDIANKREKIERENAEKAIRDLQNKKPTTTMPVKAAVGSASETGDEAGSAIDEWLQQAVKEKWTWPDRKRKDLSAEIEVNFASNGKIIGYRVKLSSGDARFDKSLTDAFIKLDTLPKPLGKSLQETFLFNLDDLQGQ